MRAFGLFVATLAFIAASLSARAETLVFAAASLTDALNDVGAAYEKTGKTKPTFSYAASSALARQIENGAPAAIFISADEQWMDYLADRKLIAPSSRLQLLGNSVVLIAPAAAPLNIKIAPNFALAQALGTGKLAMGDPDSVPVGKYGKAALENLGVWAAVERSVVRAENVRAALAFVERGEAKAGIVYATDAAVTKNVKVVDTFPASSHPAVTYPIALLGNAPPAEAKEFYAYLTSASAKEIYRRYGFTVK
jgi:molybdate transport system substrate-binding protein